MEKHILCYDNQIFYIATAVFEWLELVISHRYLKLSLNCVTDVHEIRGKHSIVLSILWIFNFFIVLFPFHFV